MTILEHDLYKEVVLAMTKVPKSFSVPLAVDGKWGYNMSEMTKFA